VFRVKSPQDFGAGLVFVLIGGAGIYFGADLTFGTSARMGPGYFPLLLSGLIILVGIIVGFKALAIEGPPVEAFQFRPILFITAAILLFGYLLDTVGLALTTVVLTLVAAGARRGARLTEALLLGGALALFAVLIFVYALSQPLPAWWGR
jgi:putative tricarboxylic transport membrane protein